MIRPCQFIPDKEPEKKPYLDDVLFWGLMLHCLDSYERYGDLRAVETKVVAAVADRIQGDRNLISAQETEWCEKIANADAAGEGASEHTRKWSLRYAIATIVTRKLYGKKQSDEGFENKLEDKRKAFNDYVAATRKDTVDWHVTPVPSNTRHGALESALAPAESNSE